MAEVRYDEIRPTDWQYRLKARMLRFFRQLDPRDYTHFEGEEKTKVDRLTDIINKEAEEHPDLPKNILDVVDLPYPLLGTLLKVGGGMLGGMVLSSLIQPMLTPTSYAANRAMSPYRLPPEVVFRLAWKLYKGEDISEELLNNLRDQGWSKEKIDEGLEASKVMPTPSDVVAFLAHEVFEPDMVEKYKLMSEWDGIDKEFAKKIGIDEETLAMYWKNHWVHPSPGSVYSMLHRDLIDNKDVDEYYRLVETPEYWRPKLTELSWDMPNRIEIRMMARYLNLDKDFVKDMLKKAGLHEDYRDASADFMLVMGLQGYWSTMYRNGWLTKEGLLAEIEAKELDPVIAKRVYKYIVKYEKPERTLKERDLTKTDIYKGVKKEVITRDMGASLLQDLGYDKLEADFLLTINVPVEETTTEVKRRELTKADILKGLKTKVITESEALDSLIKLRYIPDDARFLLAIFKAAVSPPKVAKEREASKADVLQGVKKGLITPKEGYLMLQDIGYSPEASHFILQVRAEESPFSPTTPLEFRQLVDGYKKALGEEVRELPAEVLEAEKLVIALEARHEEGTIAKAPQQELNELRAEIALAKVKYQDFKALYEL